MQFYLGTHEPSWVGISTVPLFLSRRRLGRRKSFRRALAPWSLDSGGFTELQMFGRWETPARQYADEAMDWMGVIGSLDFAAIQDWMCEPIVIAGGQVGPVKFVGTKLSVPEHQRRTVASYLELRDLAPWVPWAPVLQGWEIDDYLRCAEMYREAGVDLAWAPRVGVGSVCRRQGTTEIVELFQALRPLGLKLHAFGVKGQFLKKCFGLGLASCDSLAWSLNARKRGKPLDGCTHKTCANCRIYAERWREAVISYGRRPQQELMYLEGKGD